MKAKKVSFTVRVPVDPDDEKNKETKEVKLDVRTPNLDQVNKAQMAYNRGLDSALRSKAPLRIEVEALLKERGIWNDIKESEFKEKQKELDKLVNKLIGGGIKLTEARLLALDIRDKRTELANMNAPRRILDLSTAEAQAEQARFTWFVANSVVYSDTGKPFFADEEDYLNKGDNEYAQECARQFSMLQYGLDPDVEKRLPENAFLLKFKFVREKDLRLVDRQGNLVDRDGNYVDEEGFLLDSPGGRRVDHTGTSLNKEGQAQVESHPYLDEDNSPLVEPALV